MMLGPDSSTIKCTECHSEIRTDIKEKAGWVPILSGIAIACFGEYNFYLNYWNTIFYRFIFGCCLIPCFIKDCLDVEHYCPNCKAYLGRFKRFE